MSKRMNEAAKLVDKSKLYDISEALDLALKMPKAKFDETVEVHVKLGVDSKQADQQVRGVIVLPHGTGKSKKVFPGYVLVRMYMEDETWYVVKHIKGVFNFVGVGEKPLPLTEKEMQALGIDEAIHLDYEVGDSVRIITEPFYNYPATIEEIFKDKKRVKVKVSMFGRETTVDLEFDQIQKI